MKIKRVIAIETPTAILAFETSHVLRKIRHSSNYLPRHKKALQQTVVIFKMASSTSQDISLTLNTPMGKTSYAFGGSYKDLNKTPTFNGRQLEKSLRFLRQDAFLRSTEK